MFILTTLACTPPSPTCRVQQKDTLTLRVQPWTVCGWEDLPSPEAPWVGSSEAPSQRRVDMELMDTNPWGSRLVLLPQVALTTIPFDVETSATGKGDGIFTLSCETTDCSFPAQRASCEASQGALVVKNLPANAGDIRDAGSIPRSGKGGGGHGNPCQHSCLENPMDRGAWWATLHGATKSRTRLK